MSLKFDFTNSDGQKTQFDFAKPWSLLIDDRRDAYKVVTPDFFRIRRGQSREPLNRAPCRLAPGLLPGLWFGFLSGLTSLPQGCLRVAVGGVDGESSFKFPDRAGIFLPIHQETADGNPIDQLRPLFG